MSKDGRLTDNEHGALTWNDVAQCLAPERNYWLCTTNNDGSPHAVPVWGVVVEANLYLFSERHTAKVRNVNKDPRVVLHRESADNVVIVHGQLDDLGAPSINPIVLEALGAKYDRESDKSYLPQSDSDLMVIFALRPHRALLWDLSAFEQSQRRWISSV